MPVGVGHVQEEPDDSTGVRGLERVVAPADERDVHPAVGEEVAGIPEWGRVRGRDEGTADHRPAGTREGEGEKEETEGGLGGRTPDTLVAFPLGL